MRRVAVAATAAELAPTAGRALWDRELLYRSMVRWGRGAVVPIERRVRWRTAVGTAARAAAAVPRRSERWRGSTARRLLRDVAQVQRVVVADDVEVLYGHIVFPVATRPLPTLWSTQGVLDARPGEWFPDQSARTHARMVRRAAVVQCWSRVGADGLLEREPALDDGRLHVVPPLVDVELPSPVRDVDDGDVLGLFVGAFGHLKSLPEVVDAVRRCGPGLRLDVVTDDPPPPDLPRSIRWLGPRPRDEVLGRLAGCDIHVFPSTTESFGGAAVEALAAGVPQLVARGTVPAEIAAGAAVEVEGGDPASFADGLDRLAGDAVLRQTLGRAAATRYASTYAPAAVGPRLEALVEQAVTGGAPPTEAP